MSERNPLGRLLNRFSSNPEAKEKDREMLRALTRKLHQSSLAAYAAGSFHKRDEMVTEYVAEEIMGTARHLTRDVARSNGPWKSKKFWSGLETSLKKAVAHSSRAFEPAFDVNGRRIHNETADAAYKAAFDEPGPAEPNQVYLYEVMALLHPEDKLHLEKNEGRYIGRIQRRVEEAMRGIGFLTLRDVVIKEIGISEVELETLSEEPLERADHIFTKLDEIVKDDYFKEDIITKRAMQVDGFGSYGKKPEEAMFVRLAALGANATWKAAQDHKAVSDENTSRISPDKRDQNYRSLADYMHHIFEKMRKDGYSTSDAVLRITYELWKDMRILKQENRPIEKHIGVPRSSAFAPLEEADKFRGPIPDREGPNVFPEVTVYSDGEDKPVISKKAVGVVWD